MIGLGNIIDTARANIWPIAFAVLALFAAVSFVGWQRESANAEELRIDLRLAEAEADAAERRTMVLEKAAAERAMDTSDIRDLEEGLSDAIDKAAAREPVAPVGAATRALGCERLRRAGQTTSARYRAQCG
ncbi:hypothetical protein [Sphingomonas baiyangensis]|uniref:Uncharacterized protein n=1 Tax=Sphingomonas baiyangensis TaxID=2572576 RepID=A0A4U1L2H6_9SPHN|nr:hypothetical protein [Sphingomonas baiyangensis]TKD50236.1 hypothetical protein FBR43_05295 [Sphingomonas baiyangensis]